MAEALRDCTGSKSLLIRRWTPRSGRSFSRAAFDTGVDACGVEFVESRCVLGEEFVDAFGELRPEFAEDFGEALWAFGDPLRDGDFFPFTKTHAYRRYLFVWCI